MGFQDITAYHRPSVLTDNEHAVSRVGVYLRVTEKAKMRTNSLLARAGLVLILAASTVSAANYTVDWLQMAPTPFGSSVPNNSVYNLPGVGNVTITYSLPTSFTNARFQDGFIQNGNVSSGGDNYAWTSQEVFGTTNLATSNPVVGTPWRITYTFPGVQPAGSILLGTSGFGQTTSLGGGASTATVNQNGTFLGDWSGAGNYGPTQFTPGLPFQMQNSVTGPGGQDPWWNSAFGVVRIDDPISSLTIEFSQISGDGLGVNIGHVVPEPATLVLLAMGGLAMIRRRR